jgi:hypothetical protein
MSADILTAVRTVRNWTTNFRSVLKQSDSTADEADKFGEADLKAFTKKVKKPKEDVVTLLKPISEDFGLTPEPAQVLSHQNKHRRPSHR